jgi:hypothetical protein
MFLRVKIIILSAMEQSRFININVTIEKKIFWAIIFEVKENPLIEVIIKIAGEITVKKYIVPLNLIRILLG